MQKNKRCVVSATNSGRTKMIMTMQKNKPPLRLVIVLLVLVQLLISRPSEAQYIRQSLFQHQLDALLLNPAFAGSVGAPYFDATYLTSFSSGATFSRSALISAHGPSGTENKAGFGGTVQFFKSSQFGEFSLRPAYSRKIPISFGNLTVGLSAGINYFDFEDDGFGAIPKNFGSIEAGAGLYFFTDRFFAGLAAPNVFETDFFSEEGGISYIPRERNFNFHTGILFRLYENIKARPIVMLRYADLYELPKDVSHALDQNLKAIDLQATFIVDDTYLIGLLYGYSNFSNQNDISRLGISATFVFGPFHLGYALQRNRGELLGVELPMSHIVNTGYIFGTPEVRNPLHIH